MNRRVMVLILLMVISSIGCSEDRAEIRLGVQGGFDSGARPDLQVTLREDGGMLPRSSEFVLNDATPSAGPIDTARSGTLRIACIILLDGHETNTQGVIELPLKSDWRWGVDFFIDEEDPADTCFGCIGSCAFALDPTLGYDETKKLYIVWGGNSISNPVIY